MEHTLEREQEKSGGKCRTIHYKFVHCDCIINQLLYHSYCPYFVWYAILFSAYSSYPVPPVISEGTSSCHPLDFRSSIMRVDEITHIIFTRFDHTVQLLPASWGTELPLSSTEVLTLILMSPPWPTSWYIKMVMDSLSIPFYNVEISVIQ